MLYLQAIKIDCTTNRKVSNKQYEKLGKANKMQEKTKEQSKIRKKNNHAIASTKLKDTPPPHAFFFHGGLHTSKKIQFCAQKPCNPAWSPRQQSECSSRKV